MVFFSIILIILIGFSINIAVAHIIGNVAKDRKIWISLLLSPIIGILFAVASKPIATEKIAQENDQKEEDRLAFEKIMAIVILGSISVLLMIFFNR